MDHSKFEFLLHKFKTQERKLEEYIDQDTDFKRLCRDYEELGKTILYLKNLMNVPVELLQKQIHEQQDLLDELEKEIKLFLQSES